MNHQRSCVLLSLLATLSHGSPIAQAVTQNISPSAPPPPGCTPNYSGTFGIAAVEAAGQKYRMVKRDAQGYGRDVTQLGDGQPNAAQNAHPISQIGDGQPQIATQPSSYAAPTVQPIQQIGDGQIQHQTSIAPVQQIADGQIQRQTSMAPIQQIGDGQIQRHTPTPSPTPTPTPSWVTRSHYSTAVYTKAPAIRSIPDHQPQIDATAKPSVETSVHTSVTSYKVTGYSAPPPGPSAQAAEADSPPTKGNSADDSTTGTGSSGSGRYACKSSNSLSLKLQDGKLSDQQNRVGYVASNFQVQFDGPVQAGAIYTAGWSQCGGNGTLALGDSQEFWQCKSGDFYNLYDRNWAKHCEPVSLQVVELRDC
ncbi:MAG: hypothetical protein M1831_001682 [Alyxoria varia]|nr:MAG: hypothetical protein M1831_001682 [Alyxoria varia]